MTRPILAGVWFGPETSPHARLARVCAFSAERWCAEWDRRIVHGPPPPASRMPGIAIYDSFSVNAHQLTLWTDALAGMHDGDRAVFLDMDTLIVQPLDPIWDEPFDLAYTVRLGPPFPINTGVIAVRVSPAIRSFVATWQATTQRMLTDKPFHDQWRRKFGGIQQAALGYLLTTGATSGLETRELPCRIWNCEDTSWATFDPAVTRIVHVKSLMRRVVLGFAGMTPQVKRVVPVWRAAERELLATEARTA